jgi:hypothetical protein
MIYYPQLFFLRLGIWLSLIVLMSHAAPEGIRSLMALLTFHGLFKETLRSVPVEFVVQYRPLKPGD